MLEWVEIIIEILVDAVIDFVDWWFCGRKYEEDRRKQWEKRKQERQKKRIKKIEKKGK